MRCPDCAFNGLNSHMACKLDNPCKTPPHPLKSKHIDKERGMKEDEENRSNQH
ncbi:hypothetical protein A45J_2700 [hot springs metagenome]|uniref:Uncharacterized protein n=1 Tax=hot springs metagenome TaxID=433727 RepID=A0A5J4L9Y5_9ZZZZ